MESDDNSGDNDDKVVVAMGVLNTIDCILSVLDEAQDILAQIEPIILQIIGFIITSQCMGELHNITYYVTVRELVSMFVVVFS